MAPSGRPNPGPALGRGKDPESPQPPNRARLAAPCWHGGASLGAHTPSWWDNRAQGQASSTTEMLSGCQEQQRLLSKEEGGESQGEQG